MCGVCIRGDDTLAHVLSKNLNVLPVFLDAHLVFHTRVAHHTTDTAARENHMTDALFKWLGLPTGTRGRVVTGGGAPPPQGGLGERTAVARRCPRRQAPSLVPPPVGK